VVIEAAVGTGEDGRVTGAKGQSVLGDLEMMIVAFGEVSVDLDLKCLEIVEVEDVLGLEIVELVDGDVVGRLLTRWDVSGDWRRGLGAVLQCDDLGEHSDGVYFGVSHRND